MSKQPQTWHHGLVAEWWSEFAVGGDEIEFFGRFVAEGQPALDAGCGTGRMLLPWLRAGYDVDGTDVSADMIERTAARAREEGFDPTLLVQPLHGLDPPRRYRTVVACGVFGIGSTRVQDEQALRRLHDVLEEGGTLVLDKEVPYADARRWPSWADAASMPEPWPESEPRRVSGGSALRLRTRVTAVDPLDQTIAYDMWAQRLRDGEVVEEERYTLTERMYFRDELVLLVERAGFGEVEVRGGYDDAEPRPDHEFLVYIGRKR